MRSPPARAAAAGRSGQDAGDAGRPLRSPLSWRSVFTWPLQPPTPVQVLAAAMSDQARRPWLADPTVHVKSSSAATATSADQFGRRAARSIDAEFACFGRPAT
jgi:hypothetical protein